MEYSTRLTASRRNRWTDPYGAFETEAGATKPEAAVRVFFYIGTPGNTIGRDGDFYLEEETNILYGPKAWGVWPEEGVKVSGSLMRKRKKEPQEPWSIDPSQLARALKSKNAAAAQWPWRHWFFESMIQNMRGRFSRIVRKHASSWLRCSLYFFKSNEPYENEQLRNGG
jgi:hypothetical protein